MGLVATGAGSVALVGLEKRCPNSSTGIPLTLVTPVAAPAAPTTTAPSGTGVTGDVYHRVRGIILGRGRTAASASAAKLTVSNKAVTVTLGTPLGAATGCIGYQVERCAAPLTAATVANASGLSDVTFGGTFTGLPDATFEVEIDATATPDTFRWRKNGGSWTEDVAITGSAQTLSDGVTVTFAATTGHTLADTWTRTISGTWRFIANVYGRTTATYTDSTPVGSEPSGVTVPSSDETAANYGLVLLDAEPSKVVERKDSRIESKELSASLGDPQSIPGMVEFPIEISDDARAGAMVLPFATFAGVPATETLSGTAIQRCTFEPTDEETKRVSAWGLYNKGGGIAAIPPYLFMGGVYNELAFDGLGGNGLVGMKAKGLAMGDGEFGPGIPDSGNTGIYTHAPVLKGRVREDLDSSITSLWAVITAAPATVVGTSYGTFKAKFPTTKGGTATEVTFYYRISDGHCIVGGSNGDVYVDTLDSDGYYYGLDGPNNLREPLSCAFPGDVTGLALADAFEFARPVPRPGAGTVPAYTNELIRFVPLERFGAANVTFFRGVSSADTWLQFKTGAFKFTRKMNAAYFTGPGARRPGALRTVGPITVEITLDQDFDSREFERYVAWNKTLVGQLRVEGSRIPTQPSVYSAYREGIVADFYRLEFKSIDNAVTSEGEVAQKLVMRATRLDDPNAAPWKVVTTSAQSWDFSLAATAA